MKIMKTTICLTLLLLSLGIALFAVNVEAQTPFSGAIIISSDGSINPTSAPIQKSGETYTFLESFKGNITVQRDNIVLDGAGFAVTSTVTGTETTVGVDLSYRSNIRVTNLQVSGFVQGIHLLNSTSCTIIGNNITDNIDGIRIDNSTNNSIIGNNITANRHGIHPYEGNVFYHNNFINSSDRDIFFDSTNNVDTWDNGYPSGGNYWSNYTGIDEKKGSSQSDTGSDGIGDTPHIISSNNTDGYPLMAP
jgi:parallel beta-helix repeat protein